PLRGRPRGAAAGAGRCGSGEQAGGGDRLGGTGGVDDAAGGPPVAVVDVPSADLDDGDGAAPHRQRDLRQRPPGTPDGADGVGGVDDDVVAGLAEAGGPRDGQVGPGGAAVGGGQDRDRDAPGGAGAGGRGGHHPAEAAAHDHGAVPGEQAPGIVGVVPFGLGAFGGPAHRDLDGHGRHRAPWRARGRAHAAGRAEGPPGGPPALRGGRGRGGGGPRGGG